MYFFGHNDKNYYEYRLNLISDSENRFKNTNSINNKKNINIEYIRNEGFIEFYEKPNAHQERIDFKLSLRKIK